MTGAGLTHREELASLSVRRHPNRHTGCRGYSKRDDHRRAEFVNGLLERRGIQFQGWAPVDDGLIERAELTN